MPFILPLLLAAQPVAVGAQEAAPQTETAVDWEKEFGIEKKVRDPVTGEFPVDPYPQASANLGASPASGDALAPA